MSRCGNRLSPQQRDEAVRRYEAGESTVQLSRAFGVAPSAIGGLLARRGVARRTLSASHRRYTLNEAAFSCVTEQSAYWAGFLMADGCVYKNSIILGLDHADVGHVEAFRDFLSAGHPLKKQRNLMLLSVRSARLSEDLATFGVLPNKSLTATVSRLEADRHFWRGLIDGDGWVGQKMGRYPAIHLYGSQQIIEQFLTFARTIHPGCRSTVRPHKMIFMAVLSGTSGAAVISALYEDAAVALPRKAEKAHAVLRQWRAAPPLWTRTASFEQPALF